MDMSSDESMGMSSPPEGVSASSSSSARPARPRTGQNGRRPSRQVGRVSCAPWRTTPSDETMKGGGMMPGELVPSARTVMGTSGVETQTGYVEAEGESEFEER